MARAAARLDPEALYEYAVRALARRGRSEAELRRLLARRADSLAAITAVVARLRAHGYLDDARLAEHSARFERDRACHGRLRALQQLRARGLAPALAAAAVGRAYAEADEDVLLAAFCRKKRLAAPQSPRQAASALNKLRRAGFSVAACQRALRAWRLDPAWGDMLESSEVEEEQA
ncbi:MAG: regulatory protein RecX [Terriglobales bacterium]